MEEVPSSVAISAAGRIEANREAIEHTLSLIAGANPLAAETDPARLVSGLAARMMISPGKAALIADRVRKGTVAAEGIPSAEGAEAVWGEREFVGISFLERGIAAAKAVARIAYPDGRPKGTGFLISDRLFITNNHVIPTAAAARSLVVEFDYEFDINGQSLIPTRFQLDPSALFITQETNDLDYTVVAIGRKIDGRRDLAEFGWNGLSGAANKHMLGETANIVQHPDGRRKEIVLRENRLAARLETVLHYVADTEPGSSGSPVFNNQWQVIALHHWGGPWRQTTDEFGRKLSLEVNEGIRASAIVLDLKKRAKNLSGTSLSLLRQALESGESAPPAPAQRTSPTPAGPSARIEPDGRVVWQIPLEISVNLPSFAGQAPAAPQDPVNDTPDDPAPPPPDASEHLEPDEDFSERDGYDPKFLRGFALPLPALGEKIASHAAVNREAAEDDDPNELKYHHFSVVMNRPRKLAFFTACNIDGAKAKKLNRTTGDLGAYGPRDFRIAREAAEAAEKWFADPRLAKDSYTDPDTQYSKQNVPGYPRNNADRMARMLQQGHLVRRMDPVWGSDDIARSAEADTFFVTNRTPQFGAFNMGTGGRLGLDGAGTGGGVLWRALEDHVLGNAVEHRMKVTCFTGPVFKRNDPEWRGIRIPLRYWKICVWLEGKKLRSLAMLADQGPVYRALTALPEGAEEAETLSLTNLVEDFLTTVEEIEKATQLDFGDDIRKADIRGGGGDEAVTSFDQVPPLSDDD